MDILALHVLWELQQILVVCALGLVELLVPCFSSLSVSVFTRENVRDNLPRKRSSIWVGSSFRCMEAYMERLGGYLMGA